MHHEHQGVVVLNLLHGRFSGEGMPDDGIVVHPVPSWDRLPGVQRLTCFLQSSRAIESHFRTHFSFDGSMLSLQYSLFGLKGIHLGFAGG